MDYDFSQLNLQYLIQARDIARHDPEMAAVLLGMPIKLVHMLAELNPETMTRMMEIRIPLLIPRDQPLWWSRLFKAVQKGKPAELQAVFEHASLICAP